MFDSDTTTIGAQFRLFLAWMRVKLDVNHVHTAHIFCS